MISSHILSELEEICDTMAIIEHGRLVFSGTMDGIRTRMGISRKMRVRLADGADLGAAMQALSALPQVVDVSQVGPDISVNLHDGHAHDGIVARTLVKGGFDILALSPEQVRLDDAFLELTKGMVH
jgi:ABC-2 type transport system ATP-binding protein